MNKEKNRPSYILLETEYLPHRTLPAHATFLPLVVFPPASPNDIRGENRMAEDGVNRLAED